MKNKVGRLYMIIKLPPPLTGATYMNELIAGSKLLNKRFSVQTTSFSFKRAFGDKKFMFKVKVLVSTYLSVLKKLLFESFDIVYFQISPLGLAFIRDALLILIIKIKVQNIVVHLHGLGIRNATERSPMIKFFYQIVFAKLHVIVLSPKVINDISDVIRSEPFILPNCIPDYNLPKTELKRDVVKILFLSNLFKFKGVLDLILALKLIFQKNIKFTCTIVGEEGDISREELISTIDCHGLGHLVSYKGGLTGDEKFAEFLDADIFVFPSHKDIWGLVVLEAMQSGLPTVAYDTGAITDMIIDGETGFICEQGDVNSLATKIEMLIIDPGMRKTLGDNARNRFKHFFTFEKLENNLSGIFEKILSRNKSC